MCVARGLPHALGRLLAVWAIALLCGGAATGAFAQAAPGATGPAAGAPDPVRIAPVMVDGRELFRVAGVSMYPAERRAGHVADQIDRLAADPRFSTDQLRLEEEEDGTAIFGGDAKVMVVIDTDARAEGVKRHVFARLAVEKIKEAVRVHREERTAGRLTESGLYTAAITALFLVFLWIARWLMPRTVDFLKARLHPRVEDLEARSFGMLDAAQFWTICVNSVRAGWWLLVLVAAYAYVDVALAQFPWTRFASGWLLNLVLDPLRIMARGVTDSIPGLAFIAVLVVVVHYLLLWLRLIFLGIGAGSIRLAGFEREWSMPTFRALRVGIIALAVVVAYPYIPGSSTDAFKGVSVLAGVLFSIGSSSMLGNVISGYILIYQKAFHVGDRVMIGEHLGDVMEIKNQVTILRTVHREEVVIPNSAVMASKILNYSATARAGGFLVYTAVTIGYDTPWRQVEAMLLAAADRTPGLLKNPKPFVLKRGLEDFYVKYELNAYSVEPANMLPMYSDLHKNILDAFNEHGVQIMSPHYFAQPDRDLVVPKEKWFAAPARPPGEAEAPGKTDR